MVVLMKTRKQDWTAFVSRLHELHPYDTPECIATRIATGSPRLPAVARGFARAGGKRERAPPESLVLGIETSCDDTSVAVLENGVTLRAPDRRRRTCTSSTAASCLELASRAHLELLPRMVKSALGETNVEAVRPHGHRGHARAGLVGSLVVGLAFGKAYGAALRGSGDRGPTTSRRTCTGDARARRAAVPARRADRLGRPHRTGRGEGVRRVPLDGRDALTTRRGEAYDKVAKRPRAGRFWRAGDRSHGGQRPPDVRSLAPDARPPGFDFVLRPSRTAVGAALKPFGEPPYPDAR